MSNVSKLISLILRHDPAKFGVVLDRAGWTSVDALLAALATHGRAITRAELEQLVATSDKQRFALEGDRIRANQGHSVDVELELEAATPPDVLYHGTVDRYVESIRAKGLVKGERHHVHLSADRQTAERVGARRGKPVVLTIDAGRMAADGHAFFLSANGVWLVETVPPAYLAIPHVAATGRVQIARTTLGACDAGFYTNGRGERVALDFADAVAGSVLVETLAPIPHARRETSISVTGESTIEALVRLAGRGHLGCLNFASAKHPGGGFLGGAQAQEETLARSSALYPCLQAVPEFYASNLAQRSPAYLDLAIYSPDVPFFRDDAGDWLDTPVRASVITCAAPNAGALANAGMRVNLRAIFKRRARLVLDIARRYAIDTLVLGAWGAGVFRNDPALVADVFGELLAARYAGAFDEVVFAVMGEGSANYRAFVTRFGTRFGVGKP